MSILNIVETIPSHSTSRTPTNTTYTRSFQVVLDVLSTDFLEIYNTPQIPKIGASHPSHNAAKVTNIDIGHVNADKLIYEVTVTYETNKEDNEAFGGGYTGSQSVDPDGFYDPVLESPRISFSFQDYEETIGLAYSRSISLDPPGVWESYSESDDPGDFNSNVQRDDLVNSAGSFVSDGLKVINSYPIITISQNLRNINLTDLIAYHNTVNGESIFVAGYTIRPNEGLIKVNASAEFDSKGDQYWTVTQTILIDIDRRHHEVIVNAGKESLLEVAPGEFETETLYETDGKTKVRKPVRLGLEGEYPTGDKVFIKYKKFKSTNWAGIEPPLPKTDGDTATNAEVKEREEAEEA